LQKVSAFSDSQSIGRFDHGGARQEKGCVLSLRSPSEFFHSIHGEW
jgi:hypothetical protein